MFHYSSGDRLCGKTEVDSYPLNTAHNGYHRISTHIVIVVIPRAHGVKVVGGLHARQKFHGKMPKTLYLIRHGQAAHNLAAAERGHEVYKSWEFEDAR
jgi:hypothetical protein